MTSEATHEQSQLRVLLASVAGFLAVACALVLAVDRQPPLSPHERQLVGAWSTEPGGDTRNFTAEREFYTSNGQFRGVWQIERGRLTVTYWQPLEFPSSISPSSIGQDLGALWRSRQKYTYTWEIEFSAGGRQHCLSHPVDELHRDGKWWWTRETNR